MKKSRYSLVAVAIIALAIPIHAQDFYTGVKGGLNFADMKISFADPTMTNYETKSRTLFAAGGFFGISLNEYLSVQLEPMYVAKGGLYSERSTQEMKMKSSQLDLPLVAKVGFGEQVRPYVLAGPFMSIVLDANVEAELAGRVWEGDLSQVLKNTEYGVMFGAGVGIPVWKGSVLIEGRYALGLSNLNKGGGFDLKSGNLIAGRITTDPNDEIKSRNFLVMVGYQLPLN